MRRKLLDGLDDDIDNIDDYHKRKGKKDLRNSDSDELDV